MAEHDDPHLDPSPSSPDTSRRGFLGVAALGIGAGVAAVALGPAIAMLTHPLGHATTSSSDAFLPAGRRTRYKGPAPIKVDLYADKVDAWNRVVQVKVGSAWVLEQGSSLMAFSTVCPHLGCGIDFDADKGKFLCACHTTWFGLDGSVEEGPSPRGMDTLETKLDEKLVQIRYQRFKQGTGDKEPLV